MGDNKYSSFGILLLALILLAGHGYSSGKSGAWASSLAQDANGQVDIIETVTFKDANGLVYEEYAFREPARGLPNHVLDMFCSSVRVRLYWDVLRDEIKQSARKGLYLRRMARLAKHIFQEIRDVDKPFNATQLSVVDEFMAVDVLDTAEDQKLDKTISETQLKPAKGGESEPAIGNSGGGGGGGGGSSFSSGSFEALKGLKEKIAKRLSPGDKSMKHQQVETTSSGGENDQQEDAAEHVNSSDLIHALEKEGPAGEVATRRLEQFLKKLTFKKVALSLYTRWRTMWWMMMSCLFAKYYLWDPALEEFLKLKRTLLMWPELQLAKMHELKCKPLVFFRRVMDICKILNPLMRIDFGQFNLEKLTRFKSDQ